MFFYDALFQKETMLKWWWLMTILELVVLNCLSHVLLFFRADSEQNCAGFTRYLSSELSHGKPEKLAVLETTRGGRSFWPGELFQPPSWTLVFGEMVNCVQSIIILFIFVLQFYKKKDDAELQTAPLKATRPAKMCRYGASCTRKDCKFRHECDIEKEYVKKPSRHPANLFQALGYSKIILFKMWSRDSSMVRAPACQSTGRVYESRLVEILSCGPGQGTLPYLLHPRTGM